MTRVTTIAAVRAHVSGRLLSRRLPGGQRPGRPRALTGPELAPRSGRRAPAVLLISITLLGGACSSTPLELDREPSAAGTASVGSPERVRRGERLEGRVVAVADGDTIEVLDAGRAVRVRLAGVDAPEQGQAHGAAAKRFTSETAYGREVVVEVRDVDRYGRAVAEVSLPDGSSLNRRLVAGGYAWHYARYSKDEDLARLEREARQTRAGLWRDPQPIPPWDFRRAERGDGDRGRGDAR